MLKITPLYSSPQEKSQKYMAGLSLWVHPRFTLHLGKDKFFLCFPPLPSSLPPSQQVA